MQLTSQEGRVLGALVEKELTTPQGYPLTDNALLTACNQTTSRDPVVSYDVTTLRVAVRSLREQGLLRTVHRTGERSDKHRHELPSALDLSREQVVVLAVLLLRGPQTAAEVRARSERMHAFAGGEEVERVLGELAGRTEPLAVRLERQPGRKEARWAQLLAEGGTAGQAAPARAAARQPATAPPTPTSDAVARVQSALDRLGEVDRRTGCVADRDDDAVLAAAAQAPRGVLHGEPVTVKDWIDVTGFRCSGGETRHSDRRPTADAPAVARLRAAGAIVVAKSAVHVDSERFGPVRHPRDPALSPGGSSSGDAAAVAGGAVRLGIGSDSGGSVRVPAAWCGVVGLKPSAGLVPTTGHFPRLGARSDGRTVLGPLAASVDVAWQALTLMAGGDDSDGAVAPVPLGDPDAVDVAALRVSVGSPGDREVSQEVHEALEHARSVLADAGSQNAGPPPDWVDEALRVTEAYWQRDARSGEQIEQDLVDWDRFRHRVLRAHRDVDVIVTPTVATTAPPHRPMRTSDYLFCLPASLSGAPAVTVPVGNSAVQVVARRWSDHVAAAVARLIESGP